MSPQEQLNMMGKQLEMVLKQLADLRKKVSPKNGFTTQPLSFRPKKNHTHL